MQVEPVNDDDVKQYMKASKTGHKATQRREENGRVTREENREKFRNHMNC